MKQEDFIRKSHSIHGDAYDYSKAEYKGAKVKVCIICPKHGEFWQTPSAHFQGQGCPKCGAAKISMARSMDTSRFIENAVKVHGDKYDYSKVEYKTSKDKVCIICPQHGEFWQAPCNHLQGQGCPTCGGRPNTDNESFIEKAREVHGDSYTYDKVEYVNSKTKVCITCPKHGDFWQIPNSHLLGHGCPICGNEIPHGVKGKGTEQFIEEAKTIHGNKYDYSKVEYKGANEKVCIICPQHGEFWQTPHNHLRRQGCPMCGKERTSISKCHTKEQFIEKAKKKHNDKYDYSKVVYKGAKEKVLIICPHHGEFWQLPYLHIRGQGCPICGGSSKSSTAEFIKRARKVHGDYYAYDMVKYVNTHTKVCITCPKHGNFWQAPNDHLHGQGCPKCGNIKKGVSKRKQINEFISQANLIHNNAYDYSKAKYSDAKVKVCIICPKHGEFWQSPDNHLQGKGCPKCGGKVTQNLQDFIEQANKIHYNAYDYSKSVYVNSQTKICITCPKHGEFWQSPNNHLQGKGCPSCAHSISKAENDVYEYVSTLMPKELIVQRSKSLLPSHKELDIYIPSMKVAIEFNGLYWHSELYTKDHNYHLDKLNECNEQGINLIQIFEDEWSQRQDVVKSKIKHILGLDDSEKVYARKCQVIEFDGKDIANAFLDRNHIQGHDSASVRFGALYNSKLIAVMTFINEGDGKWNLSRFATDNSLRCIGVASKLFKHFVRQYNPTEVKSFADRRWTLNKDNNLYTKLGFSLDKVLPPNYMYLVDHQRKHKFGFRKQKLHKKYGLPLSMTEYEMTQQLGFYRVWDCGLFKYVWRKPNKDSNNENTMI